LSWEARRRLVVGVLSLVQIKVRCRCSQFDYSCCWRPQAGLGLDGWRRLAIRCWGQHFHRKEFIEVNLVFVPALFDIRLLCFIQFYYPFIDHTCRIQHILLDILNVVPGLWEELALGTALAGRGAANATQARLLTLFAL
jgi:hypothetical protein